MSPQLSPEQRRALSQHPDKPLELEDPETHGERVLMRMDVYEQMQQFIPYDASEPDPREFYPAFQKAVQDDIDAPGIP